MFAPALFTATLAASAPLCDAGPSAAQIDSLENQAFAAMKAAAEQVNAAARGGAVGSAGDAEWATYKSLRAQAEQLRLERIRAAAACQSASPPPLTATASQPPEARSETASAAPDTGIAPRRFALSVSVGGASYDEGTPNYIGMTNEYGSVQGLYLVPIGAPPPTSPTGLVVSPIALVANRVNGQGPSLDAHAWSNEINLAVTYAPAGQDRSGWRFGGRLGLQDLTLKQFLAAPLPGQTTYGAFTATYRSRYCFSPTNCYDGYDGSAPFVRQVYAPDGLVNAPSVNFYNILGTQQRTDGELSIAYRAAIDWPFGRVNTTVGATLAGVWYELKESSVADFTVDDFSGGGGLPSRRRVVSTDVRRAHGPGLRTGLNVALDGQAPVSLPLRWSLFAGVALENVSLTAVPGVNVPTQLSKQHQTTGFIGAGLGYDFSQAISADFTVRRRDDFAVLFQHLDVIEQYPIKLYPMQSVVYNLGLSYRF